MFGSQAYSFSAAAGSVPADSAAVPADSAAAGTAAGEEQDTGQREGQQGAGVVHRGTSCFYVVYAVWGIDRTERVLPTPLSDHIKKGKPISYWYFTTFFFR